MEFFMVLAFVLWVLGIASVVYFGAYAFIIGLNNSFTYFWLLLGVVLMLLKASCEDTMLCGCLWIV